MAVAEDVGGDADRVAARRLHRPAAAVDDRAGELDADAAGRLLGRRPGAFGRPGGPGLRAHRHRRG